MASEAKGLKEKYNIGNYQIINLTNIKSYFVLSWYIHESSWEMIPSEMVYIIDKLQLLWQTWVFEQIIEAKGGNFDNMKAWQCLLLFGHHGDCHFVYISM